MFDNKTLHFDGNELIRFQKTCDISNTFTYEFWVKAEEEQILDPERNVGADGLHGRKYVVGPDFYPVGAAGCGISVGTNGISVYEHCVNHLPARLVFPHDFSDWQHVAVVSDNKKLQLYINGHWIKEEGAVCKVDQLFPSLGLGGHFYGMFKGDVREFRLWSSARTGDEINAYLFSSLNGEEKDLYFYRDPDRGISVNYGIKRDLAVSVIIPSHNRYPLNHFSLLSLDRQHFPPQQMEVVFVDDASSDSTASVYEIVNPGYSLICVQLKSNRGRSKVRNLGASIAVGRTLIFVDAEMICDPEFISAHANHHLKGERNVVSGAMRSRRIYTVADPNYSPDQITNMKESYSGHPIAAPLIDRFIQGDRTPVQLLPFEMMFDPAHLQRWSFGNSYFENILSTYGTRFKHFQYSWINMITNNVSLTKRFFEEVGGFDGHFEGFGWEDWELGYRAAQKGAIFIHDDALINYHQEHPILPDNSMQSRQNYLKFCEKYPDDIEIKLLVLTMLPDWVTLPEINAYLSEIKQIRAIYSRRFKTFNQYVDTALNQLLDRLQDHGEISLPVAASVLSDVEESAVKDELFSIETLASFPRLLELHERLSRYYF